ncbi:unnamed protein product [Prorocentrum cordatum]|uniref:Solute carrier family 40 protein n=1 Tax=Prorocentrum cordatum TaxID=2364126 RepID=A0ABN9TIG3_9DINO|nr:unnamed protein product [Polarella glacialis]
MHRGWVSLEAMLAIGAGCCLGGMLLMGPIGPVQSMLASRDGWQPWTLQVLSFVVTSSGLAATFIPTLPLLQREVRHLGDQAVEQVAQTVLTPSAVSLGEAAGPILGGALTARVGFVRAAAVCAAPMALVLVGSLLWPGPAPAGVAGLDVPLDGPDPADEPYPLPVFLDGESAFRVRQMSFAFIGGGAPRLGTLADLPAALLAQAEDEAPALGERAVRDLPPRLQVVSRRQCAPPARSLQRGRAPATSWILFRFPVRVPPFAAVEAHVSCSRAPAVPSLANGGLHASCSKTTCRQALPNRPARTLPATASGAAREGVEQAGVVGGPTRPCALLAVWRTSA